MSLGRAQDSQTRSFLSRRLQLREGALSLPFPKRLTGSRGQEEAAAWRFHGEETEAGFPRSSRQLSGGGWSQPFQIPTLDSASLIPRPSPHLLPPSSAPPGVPQR